MMNGDTVINSEILVYSRSLHEMEHFQYIETNGALDWEYFGFGKDRHREHFLAVVNNPDSDEEQQSMIYKYQNGLFVTFQCIMTTGATRWHAITDEAGDLLLLALATVTGVEYYEYTGWWFRPTNVQYGGLASNSSIYGLASVYWNNTFLLGAAGESDSDESSHVFQLSFTQYSPLKQRHAELEASCKAQQERLHNLTQEVEAMRNQSTNLVYIDSSDEQIITGNFNFTLNITVQNIQVNNVYASSGMILSEDGMRRMAVIKTLTSNHTEDINELMDTWDDNTMKIYGDQTVTGEKEFHSITVTDGLTVDSLIVESGIINSDVSLNDLDNNTARTDRTQTFISPITIANEVTVQGDLHVNGEIDDGIVTSEVVTLAGDHTITVQKHFQDNVSIKGNLDVEGTIDGIDVSNESLLLTTNDQTFTGDLTFLGDLYYEDDVAVEGLVAGIDLCELKLQAVYNEGLHNITGDKYFTGDVTMTSGIEIANGYRIDGVDVELLNDTAMRISIEQRVTGGLNFSQDVSILAHLHINGDINALHIPDSVLLADSAQEVTLMGALTFDTDVNFDDLWCTDTIDGIRCHADGSGLDIMLLSGNQDVSGSITFLGGVWLDGSSTVSGLVDGVNITMLAADAVYVTGDQIISGSKTIDGAVNFRDDITVEGLINGVNLTELDAKALKLTDGQLQADGQLIFEGPVIFEQALVTNDNHNLGNNLTLPDLVTQGSLEDIHGMKTFTSDVLSDGYLNVTGYVNGINLQDFYRDVVMTTRATLQELTANFTFADNIVIEDDLWVNGLIDGVDLDGIVSVNGTQVIYGETTFTTDLQANALSVNGSLIITGLLNGVNVSDLALNTLKKSGDQYVSGTKTFQEDASLIFGDDVTIDGLISGINITELADDAVYKTGDHVVTGEKTFQSEAQIQQLNVTGTVDGVDIDSLYSNTVQQYKTQTIMGDITFLGDVAIQTNLTVLGNISGYDLQGEVNDMVLTTDHTIDVEIHFSYVSSEGHVDIAGEIDSVNISREAILTNMPDQVITGVKTLQGPVTLLTHLHVDTVCGIDISALEQTIVYDDGDQIITGHKTFIDEIELESDLHVDGLVDGVNVTHLAENAMRTDDPSKSEQRVTAEMSMENLHVYEVVYYNGTLDGVDLVHLNQTYLSRTLPQTIIASKNFSGTLEIASTGTLQGGDITLEGYINGIDLGEFAEGVWLNGQEPTINGFKRFHSDILVEGNINVGGLVDGIDVRNNMMLTNANSLVTGNKTFTDDIIVESSIIADEGVLVDGVDISKWDIYAARLTDNYVISITISISDIELQQNLIVGELTDNIPLNFDGVLATVRDQTVTGHKSFIENVIIEGALTVDRYINGIDVVELLTDTLLASREQVITGNYNITQHPTFINITTLGLLYGVRVPDLYRQIHTYPRFDMLNASLLTTCEIVDRLKDAQDNVAVILQHIASLQAIPTLGHGRWHSYEYRDVQWLVEGKQTEQLNVECGNSYVYYWNETTWNYELESILESIMASDIDTFVLDDRLFMVIGSLSNATNDCFNDNMPGILDGMYAIDPDGITTLSPAILPSSLPSDSTTSILLRSNTTSELFLFQQLPCIATTSDVETFVDPITSQQCVAISNELDVRNELYDSLLYVYIYCMDNVTNGFYFKQAIPTFGVKKVSHFFVNDVLHLAIVNHVDTGSTTFLASSAIWRQTSGGDFAQLDTVDTSAGIDVVVIDVEDDTYVIFASEFEGTYGHEDYNVPFEIYQYTTGMVVPFLDWKQSIATQGVISLGQFIIDGQSFLIVLDRVDTITVYKFSGIKFFEKVHEFTVYDAVSLEVITMPYEYMDRILIAVMVYREEATLFESQQPKAVVVSSLILEVIIEGDILKTVGCSDED